MFGVTHIGDEEDETAGEEDGGACDGERQEETSGVVHESSDHWTNRQTKVERGVTPGLHSVVSIVRNRKHCNILFMFSFSSFKFSIILQSHLDSGLSVWEPCHQDGEV